MDRETAEDIKRHFDVVAEGLRSEVHELRSDVHGLRSEVPELRADVHGLRSELHELAGDLRGEVQQLAGDLRGEVQQLAGDLRSEVQELAGDLRSEIRIVDEKVDRSFVELKRYFDVVGESLRSDIRTVAEGFVSTNERLDRFESSTSERFSDLEVMIRLSFGELERRIP